MPAPPTPHSLRRAIADKAGDLLPLCDSAAVLLAGYVSFFACAALSASPLAQADGWNDFSRLAWIAAAIAPFLLYERQFSAWVAAGDNAQLVRGFARNFATFLGVIGAIAFAGRWLENAPGAWLAVWLTCTVLLTVSSRALLAHHLRRSAGQSPPAPPVPEIGHVGDTLPVTLLADRPIKRWNAVLKAAEDSVLGWVMTVMLLPVLACIALAVKLDGPGPVLFKQRRHGINNREFDIYKFRTMRCAPASGAPLEQTVRGDRRITRVGRFLRRFSLDELPQVFNVLQGDMSLVGPRPHAVNMRTEERLGHEAVDVYLHRHRVKPGISGWSQVNGSRGATDTVEQLRRRVELDLHYVENWSLLLDLKILFLTCREVVRPTNNAF